MSFQMEIINNICYLTIGEKIKHKLSGEGGLIVDVNNLHSAQIEFFDKTIDMNSEDVTPFSFLSYERFDTVLFYKEKKKVKPKGKVFHVAIPDEIDLHASLLIPDHRTMSNENIVLKQLFHLGNYIDSALRQELPRITIIHGRGTGSLRSQVIDLLESKYELFDIDASDIGKTIVFLSGHSNKRT